MNVNLLHFLVPHNAESGWPAFIMVSFKMKIMSCNVGIWVSVQHLLFVFWYDPFCRGVSNRGKSNFVIRKVMNWTDGELHFVFAAVRKVNSNTEETWQRWTKNWDEENDVWSVAEIAHRTIDVWEHTRGDNESAEGSFPWQVVAVDTDRTIGGGAASEWCPDWRNIQVMCPQC